MTSNPGPEDKARASQPAPGEELDLGSYLTILIEHRGSIVATVALTLLVGGLYVAATTPVYRANAILQIEQKGNSLGDLDQLLAHFSGETSTEIELVSSRTLIGEGQRRAATRSVGWTALLPGDRRGARSPPWRRWPRQPAPVGFAEVRVGR